MSYMPLILTQRLNGIATLNTVALPVRCSVWSYDRYHYCDIGSVVLIVNMEKNLETAVRLFPEGRPILGLECEGGTT